jgi:hypothetical protein
VVRLPCFSGTNLHDRVLRIHPKIKEQEQADKRPIFSLLFVVFGPFCARILCGETAIRETQDLLS